MWARALLLRTLLALMVVLVVAVLMGWFGEGDDGHPPSSSPLPQTREGGSNNNHLPIATSIHPQRQGTMPTLAVLCVGDSITFGNGTHSKAHAKERRGQGEGNYPLTLHSLLQQRSEAGGGRVVEVLNLGRSGRTAISDNPMSFTKTPQYTDARSYLRTWGSNTRNPHRHHLKDRLAIVLLLGTNDSKDTRWRGKGAYKEALSSLLRTFLNDLVATTTPRSKGHEPPIPLVTLNSTSIDILFLTPPPALRRPTRTRKVWSYTSILGKINTVRVATEVREAVYEVADLVRKTLVGRNSDKVEGDGGASFLSHSLLVKLHQQFTFSVNLVDVYTKFTQRLVDVSFPVTSSPAPYHRGVRVPTFPSVFQTSNPEEAVLPWGIRSSSSTSNEYTHITATEDQNGSMVLSSSTGSLFAAEKVIADRSLIPQAYKVEGGEVMGNTISVPPSFPIEALWYSNPGGAEKLLHDGIHPRRIGHDLLAQLVAEAIH